jgi:nitrogen-specific signal transduction histidine kinase
MPNANQMNWQPISQMPLIASMIKGSLDDTREHLGTLTKARDRPHVLDDATIDRVEQGHTEQMEFIDIYTQQIGRWRTEKPSASQVRELDRMEKQNQQLRGVTAEVLTLAHELRNGAIERVLGMSDLELGIQTLLGSQVSDRR